MTVTESQGKANKLLYLRRRFPEVKFKSVHKQPFILMTAEINTAMTSYEQHEIPNNRKYGRPFTHVLVKTGCYEEFLNWLANRTQVPGSFAVFNEWVQNPENGITFHSKARLQGYTLKEVLGEGVEESDIRPHNWYLYEYEIRVPDVKDTLPKRTIFLEDNIALTAVRISDSPTGTKKARNAF